MLLSALALALVVALLVRTRPPFGAVALAMGIAATLEASQFDAWRFVPAAVIAGLLVDIVLRLAPAGRQIALGASASAVGLVGAVASTVVLTTGIGWSPTLLLGVAFAAGVAGWGIGALVERHAGDSRSGDVSTRTGGMSERVERATLLTAVGIALAALQQFGPLLWPYGLGPGWSLATAGWYFVVDLVWVAAMVATYLRDPAGQMWKLFLAYRVVATLGVLWIWPTSLTWTLSQLVTGLGSVVFVHLVLAFPTGRLTDPYDRRLVIGSYVFLAVTRLGWVLVWQPDAGPGRVRSAQPVRDRPER